MRDKRPVDELSIEELERILAIRKREARQGRLNRLGRDGRIVPAHSAMPAPLTAPAAPAMLPEAEAPLPAPFTQSAAAPVVFRQETAPSFEDDAAPAPFGLPSAERRRFWKRFTNQALTLVEVVAVVGLAFLAYQMFTATDTLQRETANTQALLNEERAAAMPTLEPTPQIRLSALVLPGGHTFTDSGEAVFNYAEVPEALRWLVQDQILQPIAARPAPTSETALELSIPRLGVEQTIVQGTDWEALKLGIGQHLNGVNPGDREGNLVLSAHNDIFGEHFRYIDQLEPGDEFFVRTATQVYTYRVIGSDRVDPSEVSVLNPRGGAVATLISCYPYKVNTERYIVFAERVDGLSS